MFHYAVLCLDHLSICAMSIRLLLTVVHYISLCMTGLDSSALVSRSLSVFYCLSVTYIGLYVICFLCYLHGE